MDPSVMSGTMGQDPASLAPNVGGGGGGAAAPSSASQASPLYPPAVQHNLRILSSLSTVSHDAPGVCPLKQPV